MLSVSSFKLGVVRLFVLPLLDLAYTMIRAGNTKGGSITVPLTSCLTGLD